MNIEQSSKDELLCVALDTLKQKKQALIFVASKRSAEKTAEEIAKKTELMEEQLAEEIGTVLPKPTQQCERLAQCVKKGIAFHHAGLHSKQRELIEDNFRSGKIKMICCTPTLAAGIDMPAFRVIIKDLKRYAGKFGMQYIPVLEYLQMAGRAGRPKFDKEGQAICIAKSEHEKEEIRVRYLEGKPEEIYSKLAVEPVLRTYVLSLIATNVVKTKEELLDFFHRTFWALQYKDMTKLEHIIEKMIFLLQEWEFLQKTGNTGENTGEFVSAHDLSEKTLSATDLGKRVAELYLDPLTAHEILECVKKSQKTQCTHAFGILQMVCNTLEMRPLLRVKTKEIERIQQEILKYESHLLQNEPSIYEPEYDDFLDSLKTALMLYDWVEEKEDEYLLETYDCRPGETRSKVGIVDWLLYTTSELARMIKYQEILKEIAKLRMRIKYGVKEELLALLKLEGIGRIRARKLYNNKVKTISDVKNADVIILAQLIGKKIALNIKKQIGEEVDEEKIQISEHKRIGQMSLKKYDEEE